MGRLTPTSTMGIPNLKKKGNWQNSYALVYGEEAVLPIEIKIPSVRLRERNEIPEDNRPTAPEALVKY